jgi:hypothetical protein
MKLLLKINSRICPLYGALLSGMLFSGCMHDVDLPLRNDTPVLSLTPDTLVRTLTYPESTLCTLQVADKNDTLLFIDYSWPGSSQELTTGFGQKSIVLFFGTLCMGQYNGMSTVYDRADARDTFYYAITRQFSDNFDRSTLDSFWPLYSPADTAFVRHKYLSDKDAALQFIFPADSGQGLSGVRRAGVRSLFSITGDFSCSIEFTIFNGLRLGAETAFFVSTSRDTGLWDGDAAGVYISGNDAAMQLKCKSINGQVSSKISTITTGKLCLAQTGDRMTYLYRPMGADSYDTIARFQFVEYETLFVHFRTIVTDTVLTHESIFNNFLLSKGQLVF